MARDNWNTPEVDYWNTARRTSPPGQAAGGDTEWGKTLGIILLVIVGIIALPFVFCFIVLLLPTGG